MIIYWFLLFSLIVVPTTFLSGCASGPVTKDLNERYIVIAAKIYQAEMLGAKDHSPRELAHARVSLASASHKASESYLPLAWRQVEFDKAEITANELLSRRNLAAMP